MAFPIASMGTMEIDSILVPAEYPAMAEEPKVFTTDCTRRIPICTIDCCRMEGIATFTMESIIPLS